MVICCAAPLTTASPSASARASVNRIHRAAARVRRMRMKFSGSSKREVRTPWFSRAHFAKLVGHLEVSDGMANRHVAPAGVVPVPAVDAGEGGVQRRRRRGRSRSPFVASRSPWVRRRVPACSARPTRGWWGSSRETALRLCQACSLYSMLRPASTRTRRSPRLCGRSSGTMIAACWRLSPPRF